MNMVKDLEKNRTQEEDDPMVGKLRARLKEKEKALEVCGSSFVLIYVLKVQYQKQPA